MVNQDLSKIILGTWRFSGAYFGKDSEEDSLAVIRKAAELGIRSFDSAYFYGQGVAMKRMQKALKDFQRTDLLFYAKGGLVWKGRKVEKKMNFVALKEDLYKSLEALKTDYLDSYFFHWPPTFESLPACYEQLEKIKKTGLVKNIGFCNLSCQASIRLLNKKQNLFFQQAHSLLRPLSLELKKAIGEEKLILHSLFEQGLLFANSARHYGKKDVRRRHPLFLTPELQQFQELSKLKQSPRMLFEIYKKDFPEAKLCIGPKNCNQLEQLLSNNL